MRHGKKWALLALVLAIAMAAGCAGPQTNVRPMTGLEQAKLQYVEMSERYKIQYEDAQSLYRLIEAKQAAPAQIEVYRAKKKLLDKVWPLLKAYDELLLAGAVPSADKNREINDLLNRLAATAK